MERETKKCPYCGEEILAEAKKCKHCGEWLEPKEEQRSEPSIERSDNQAEKSFFSHHIIENCNPLFQFSGQLSRKDYWIGSIVLGIATYSVFCCVFILYLTGFLTNIFGRGALTLIITLTVLPLIVAFGMMVRRLHDIGTSGWLVLLSFVPIANFYLIYLLCQKGQTESGKTTHKPVDYICWAAIILLPFVFCFIAMHNGMSLWADDDTMEITQNTEETISEAIADEESNNAMAHGVLSASDAIMLVKSGMDFIDNVEKREEFGYDGEDFGGELIWFKNCRITIDEYSTPIPVSAERNSSYAYIDRGCFIVNAYDHSVFVSWQKQLYALGYKETNRDDDDNYITYTYKKNNNPTIWIYDGEQEWQLWVSFNL